MLLQKLCYLLFVDVPIVVGVFGVSIVHEQYDRASAISDVVERVGWDMIPYALQHRNLRFGGGR